MLNQSDPVLTVGISPTSSCGVVIAAYSGRRSRMWAWDAKSLDIIGHQDIKARVKLRDISDDGKFCSYYSEAHSKLEHFVAISRPPFFHALWLRNAFHLGCQAVLFSEKQVVRFCIIPKTEEFPWSRIIEEQIAPNCPFRFQEMNLETHRTECAEFSARCSGILEYTDNWRWQTPELPGWVGVDPMGRKITVRGAALHADGNPFLDCSRKPFEAIPTPDWAKEW